MFYVASKIIGFFILPSSFAVMLIAAGLVLQALGRWPVLSRRLAWTGLAVLLLAGFSPLGNVLILPLEQRFTRPATAEAVGPITGMIVLGGFEDGRVTAGRDLLTVNEGAERLTEAVRLARRHPNARVVFTGGAAGLLLGHATAATAIGRYLAEVGVAPDRIVLEGASRTTWENAILTRAIVGAKPGERWLLITSAFHMPRAVGVFRQAGFDVIPYPVDFRTSGTGDASRPFEDLPNGLERVDRAVKEYVGLLAYRLSGRSSALFPGP